MAFTYTKETWSDGQIITASWANKLETAFDDVKTELNNIKARILYAGDETEMSTSSTTNVSIKTLTVSKCSSAGLSPTKLYVVATLRTSNSSATATLEIFVDGTSKATLTSTSTSYELKYTSAIDISAWADNTVHTVDVRIRTSNGSYVVYNQLLEVYIE